MAVLVANYLGCFTDNPESRTLKGQMWREQRGMTIDWCFANCTWLNYTYYGLEYGRECFCGHDLSPPGVPTECTSPCMACWGNSSQCCGDSNIISVYSVSTRPTTSSVATEPSSSQADYTPTTSPPLSSASPTMPSHSSPWPEISISSEPGHITQPGSSPTGAPQTQITLPNSSTESSSIAIISSPAMSGNPALPPASTTEPVSSTHYIQHSSPTHRPSPSTVLSDPDATPVSTAPNFPLPASSEITDPASSDALDGGLNKAVIAGAAIGGAAMIAVIALGIWFLWKLKKKPEDDDISMVGMPRDEDVPLGMRNGIRLVRGNNDWN